MVDVTKVYNALSKLKEITPLYAQINLPKTASDFDSCDKITECVVNAPSTDCDDEPVVNDQPERVPINEHEREPMDEPEREPMGEPEREPMDEPEREPMGEPEREPMDVPERAHGS